MVHNNVPGYLVFACLFLLHKRDLICCETHYLTSLHHPYSDRKSVVLLSRRDEGVLFEYADGNYFHAMTNIVTHERYVKPAEKSMPSRPSRVMANTPFSSTTALKPIGTSFLHGFEIFNGTLRYPNGRTSLRQL